MLTAPTETAFAERVELVKRADRAARAYDPRIFQVQAIYADNLRQVMVATSDGVLTLRPAAAGAPERLGAGARSNGGPPQRGHAGGGGRVELSFFLNEKTPEHFAAEAAREAIVMLDAVDAPAGEMTVVLGPGWPGILLHEAVGHGLEADFNRKGVSAFSGRIGQKVASELCTVIDDGTIASRRGSLNVDDEGHPTQRNVLIENGVLRGYLQDKLSSRLTGAAVHRQRPPRKLRAHPHAAHDQHLHAGRRERSRRRSSARCRKGLYCANFGGGQVDITSGNFVFSASESYLIEDGKLTRPGAQRHPDRQRPGSVEVRQHGGQRPAAGRRHRGVRQGRPERAGGRGHSRPSRSTA